MDIGIPEIDRKYEILERMGEGGMGAIYRARHRYLDEVRVIKTIRPQLRSDAELQARFLQEAQVAAKLRHPNIAAIYDFTMTEDGLACIVMEHIDGLNLRQIQRQRGRLEVPEVLAVSRQILDALSYLHERQFVHRDISTDNVMLGFGRDGKAKATLIDLGLAKSLEAPASYTKTGMVIGKMHYIAPEQLSRGAPGVVIDERCDLYAFGVVLYELLTHQLPIQGEDQVSLIAGHLHRPPLSFEETDPEGLVPESLRTVVLKALAKKPEERFASATDLATALERAGTGATAVGKERSDPVTVLLSDWQAGGATAATLPGATRAVDVRGGRTLWARGTVKIRRWLGRRKRLMTGVAAMLAAAAIAVLGWQLADRVLPTGDGASTGGSARVATPDGVFFGRSYALLVGNNAYRLLPKLETAVNDVRAIGTVLEGRYGFSVRVLENATRTELIDTLSELAQTLTARDNLLVYYAGHGNIEFGRESWQPVDAAPDDTTQWISTQHEVSGPLGSSSARHVLVISDSCYAGASTVDALPPVRVDAGDTETIRQLVSRPSRLVMTSGGLSPVLDQGDGHLSIFARALVDALEQGEGLLGASDLFAQIQPEVARAAQAFDFVQRPTLAAIPRAGDEGGEFFFVPSSG